MLSFSWQISTQILTAPDGLQTTTISEHIVWAPLWVILHRGIECGKVSPAPSSSGEWVGCVQGKWLNIWLELYGISVPIEGA